MSRQSRVSVIIPCYNYSHFLEESIGSLVDQTYTDWECLIIDDGSTDDTKAVAADLINKDSRIKYYYQQNKGLAVARNRGFALAKGDYIQFLDADDMIHPQKIKEQVEILDNDSSIGVSYTNYQTFRDNLSNLTGRYSNLILGDKPLEDFLFKWERGLSIPIHAALFRKSVFVKNGKPFVEELMAKEDWVMWVKLADSGVAFNFLDKDYCYYRGHKYSQTADVKNMFTYFIKAIFIILYIIPSFYHEKFIESSLTHVEKTYLNIISRASLFWDAGKGFNSCDVLFKDIRVQDKLSFQLTYDLSSIGIINQLRFDPLEDYWIEAKLIKVRYLTKQGEMNELDLSKVTSNGTADENGFITFKTFDPIFFMPISGELKEIEIFGELRVLENQKIEQLILENEQNLTQIIQSEKKEVFKIKKKLKENKQTIEEMGQTLKEKEQLIKEINNALENKKIILENLEHTHNDKTKTLMYINHNKDQKYAEIKKTLTEREQIILVMKQTLEAKDSLIGEIEGIIAEGRKNLTKGELKQAIRKIKSQLSVLDDEIEQNNKEITLLTTQLGQKRHELNLVINSKSWKITAPLRVIKEFFIKLFTIQKFRNSEQGIIQAGDAYDIKSEQISRLPVALALIRLGIRKPRLSLKLAHPRRIKNAILYLTKDKGNLIQILKKYQDYYSEVPIDEIDNKSAEIFNRAKLADSMSNVFVFPVIDWNFRHQRPQHFSLELGKLGHRVFYFSTMPLTNTKAPFAIIDNPGENVYVCKLNNSEVINNIYQKPMPFRVRDAYQESLLTLMKQLEIEKSVSIINHPYWKNLVDVIPGTIIGYDCMDHHIGFHKDCSEIPKYEIELIKDADFVVTSSLRLHDNIKKYRSNIIIRNGCEVSCFSNEGDFFPKDKRPIAGYIGAIADWFDMNLIIYAAKQLKDWRFVLVGSTVGCSIGTAGKQKNIEFIGEVEYNQVPYYVRSFDVCLIPFLINELTKSTNPVKVYEYLCAGKPVVSTAIPEILMLKDKVFIGDNPEEFVKQIQSAYLKKDNPELVREWQNWASEQDWSLRVADLDKIIKSQPLISVVILTYNNIELTKACLDSIDRFTYYPHYEVIIVDNASTDGSQKYIKNFINKRHNWQLISNKHNLGFAAGNNVGINAAKGEYIVLLNNDTFVTPGWLKNLTRPFVRYNNLGITGPVTNNIGNEARIEIHYSNMEEMIDNARFYTTQRNRKILFTNNVAFFCVAIKKEVIDKVGLLDEQFEIGFFEDDDYCKRASENKYRIAIVEDSFVHHHLNATFNKMDDKRRQQIFNINKERFEAKWGEWQPHQYRSIRSEEDN